jgi:uncharacterized membrane protein YjjP (DUF1212 family)
LNLTGDYWHKNTEKRDKIREEILIISSIMLLVPGLAITNAIRDTMRTDYVSGVARAIEATICAVAIALGIVLVLSLYKGVVFL